LHSCLIKRAHYFALAQPPALTNLIGVNLEPLASLRGIAAVSRFL